MSGKQVTAEIRISGEDAATLQSVCARELQKVEAELQAIRACDRDKLPEHLKHLSSDMLASYVDPWCSQIMRLTWLQQQFAEAIPALENWTDESVITVAPPPKVVGNMIGGPRDGEYMEPPGEDGTATAVRNVEGVWYWYCWSSCRAGWVYEPIPEWWLREFEAAESSKQKAAPPEPQTSAPAKPLVSVPALWWALPAKDDDVSIYIYGPTPCRRPICEVFAWPDYREEHGWDHRKTAAMLTASPKMFAACEAAMEVLSAVVPATEGFQERVDAVYAQLKAAREAALG